MTKAKPPRIHLHVPTVPFTKTRCGRAGATTPSMAEVTCGHCKLYGAETFESLAEKREAQSHE